MRKFRLSLFCVSCAFLRQFIFLRAVTIPAVSIRDKPKAVDDSRPATHHDPEVRMQREEPKRINMMKGLVWLSLIAFVAGITRAGSLSEVLPGTSENELQQVRSPDGHSVAVLFHKERHGIALPPEPAKTLERWARLKLTKDGKTIYDSGYENLNIYQMSPGFALDVLWAPDSSRLAYRHINSLRIIGPDGKMPKDSLVPEDSVISSFRWIDNESLLVVSKKTQHSLDMGGKPYLYEGYADQQAKDIRIIRLHLTKGKTLRYRQAVNDPVFLFHSSGFCLDEISPQADRVAFSDGVNLCVYDDTAGKVITQVKIPQKPTTPVFSPDADEFTKKVDLEMAARPDELDGIWWPTNDKLVVGLELLMRQEKRAFYTFDIPSQKLTDETKMLLPLWQDCYRKSHKNVGIDYFGWQNPDWYKSAIK